MFDITLKDLQLIDAIAESGTLTGATRQLHITQSAVSQRLSKLQARLKMALVERHDGIMMLTPAGERMLAASRVVHGEIRAAVRDISSLSSQRDAHFQVATQCYTCYRWLPYVISAMRDSYPLLSVDVVPEATDLPYEAIEKRQIDLAIVSNPDPDSALPEVDLFKDEMFAVLHKSHPLAKHSFLPAEAFSGQTLLLYTGKRHAIVEEILRPASIADFTLIQVRITEAIIELARAGQGIAIISGWALDDMPNTDDLVAVRITREGFIRTWRAVFDDVGDAALRDTFIANVKRVGTTIGNQQWRQKLQQQVA